MVEQQDINPDGIDDRVRELLSLGDNPTQSVMGAIALLERARLQWPVEILPHTRIAFFQMVTSLEGIWGMLGQLEEFYERRLDEDIRTCLRCGRSQ